MGRKPTCGQLWSIAGNFSGVFEASVAMGMPWASQDGLRQAIPPAYTEWVGHQMMARL
jgi:DNA (cytosine-5)-methyltransferase 1